MDNINQLKVKGLVLGPLHTVQAGRPETLDLEEINPIHGNQQALLKVIEKAKRKGRISYSSLKLTQTFWFYDSYYAKNGMPWGPISAHHWFSAPYSTLGIAVVLDLTPNYEGPDVWFTQVAETVEKVKVWHSFEGRPFLWMKVVPSVLNLPRLLWLNVSTFHCVFQTAAEYWFALGVEGIKVSNFDTVSNSTEWSKLQAAIQTNFTQDDRKR